MDTSALARFYFEVDIGSVSSHEFSCLIEIALTKLSQYIMRYTAPADLDLTKVYVVIPEWVNLNKQVPASSIAFHPLPMLWPKSGGWVDMTAHWASWYAIPLCCRGVLNVRLREGYGCELLSLGPSGSHSQKTGSKTLHRAPSTQMICKPHLPSESTVQNGYSP